MFFISNIDSRTKSNKSKQCTNTIPSQIIYLGVGIIFQKKRSTNFAELKERLSSRASSWKERLLNQEGKGILIRGVIPAHNMTFASKFQRKFSIKSVYHVQKLDLPSLAFWDSSSSSGVSATIWKSLWNAPFMPKVENFL